jgi:phospholipid/cholesterol/gamma-HCH transport system substrate-binding protein
MTRLAVPLKFAAFAVVMTVLTVCVFTVFSQFRGGPSSDYTAVFTDVSGLKPNASVRVAGVRVGTVDDVSVQPDHTVLVSFAADPKVRLTLGTRAAVRYLNLVGDRYLELVDGPGSTRLLGASARIPKERTAPALDLDVLLGGLKPVIQGLNAGEVNALSSSLIQIMQGQGGTVDSLFAHTASLTAALADNGALIERLLDNLNAAMKTVADQGGDLSASIQRLDRFAAELAAERQPICTAIDALSKGTASLADLLAGARPPLAATIDQLARLAPELDSKKDRVDTALQKAPENYRKLIRIGSYGSFVNYYICALGIRVSDLQNRTAVFPVFKQETGRCAEPQ